MQFTGKLTGYGSQDQARRPTIRGRVRECFDASLECQKGMEHQIHGPRRSKDGKGGLSLGSGVLQGWPEHKGT
nr:hypothetical protein CFP56_56984 [Quercus suber]